jgi:TPR repeat protein
MGIISRIFMSKAEKNFRKGYYFDYALDDQVQAAIFYEKAALDGHAEAKFNLAMFHMTGNGKNLNLEKAYSLAKEAYESGFDYAGEWLPKLSKLLDKHPR